ncbi:hypothetical protein VSS74_08380 [Conexibacter stalactiti]|uniref:Uncharacterized protein n=1 Tax=Conexibacter stalactiti TaxID=1940611 RepID=A0ABU4HQM9_9ACTN|nr:hypothetical protein [Conexibacter stalactiti]MDW5594349.1 hypothetical protein [Conexibacter stalactiti]MEC5034991.1 hypothetical protein [Conexibacter stalactiti]
MLTDTLIGFGGRGSFAYSSDDPHPATSIATLIAPTIRFRILALISSSLPVRPPGSPSAMPMPDGGGGTLAD